MGLFDSVFGGTDTSALRTGAAQAKNQLGKGMDKGRDDLNEGLKKAKPLYQESAELYSPWVAGGGNLFNMYSDALGGGGQEGFDRATDAFHQAPGYQFLVDQGEQGVMRNRANLGLNSGQSMEDLTKFRVGLADQTWQQNLDNLFRGSGQGLMGAQGKSGALTGLADLFENTAARKADIATGAHGAMATNASNLGAGLQSQTAADQASQLSLLTSILGGGASVLGAYGPKKV